MTSEIIGVGNIEFEDTKFDDIEDINTNNMSNDKVPPKPLFIGILNIKISESVISIIKKIDKLLSDNKYISRKKWENFKCRCPFEYIVY